MLKKRPCCVCGRWFWPDPRVGVRQRACAEKACQRERHRRDCARYRRVNREEERVFRLKARIRGVLDEGAAGAGKAVGGGAASEREVRSMVRDEMRSEVPEIMSRISRVLVWSLRDERELQVPGIMKQFRIELPRLVRDEIARSGGVAYRGAQEAHDASGVSPPGQEVPRPSG